MEVIDFYRIDFSKGDVIQNKKIKGNALFKDFEYYQAHFVNCEFEHIIFFSNEKRNETYFQFTKCKINRIDINCFVHHLCIENTSIHSLKQEKGETEFIEIFSDEKENNNINYLMLFNSKCNRLSIKDYNINTLSLIGLKSSVSFDIENITVFQNFTLRGCLITKGNILNVTSKSDFSISLFESETDLYMGYLNCKNIHFVDKLRNANLVCKNIKCEYLRFQNFEVINSTFKLDDIVVSETLNLLESDFGNTFFVDCDFSQCQIEISFPILTNIKSLNLKFSDKISYFNQFGDSTKEKINGELIEFFRQLKYNAITQNNQYNALYYYSREMNYYLVSLKNLPGLGDIVKCKNKKLKAVIILLFNWLFDFYDLVIYSILKKRNPFERLRIWIFKYSNNFGTEWIKPTIIYIVVSYILFVIGSNGYDFTKSIRFEAFIDPNFPRFLNPINKLSFSEMTHSFSFKSSFIELISILFQGFLIYQIIKGFRKFSF